jgi:carboxylesterase type B
MEPETTSELLSSCTSASDTLSCLRSVDANILETVNANINLAGFFGTFTFVPVVDGEFITQRATEALKQGKVNGVSIESVYLSVCRLF